MKKYIISLFAFMVCVSFGLAKNDTLQQKATDLSGGKFGTKQQNSGLNRQRVYAPINVIPISMKLAEQEAEGQIRRATNGICSAMRLTPTLVLTAARCLAANKEGELAFRNGDKIAAIPTLQADGRWRLDISNDQPTNAEVIFYRPGYLSDGTSASHAFDFALIKLDDRLSRDSTILSKNVYKQFLGVTLENLLCWR